MRGKSLYIFMFLIGLFADFRVHLIGMIGISEVVICLMAPILYLQDMATLRKEGFNKILLLLFLTCVSCCISSFINHTIFPNFIRGLATPVVLLCSVIFMHHFLRKDLTAMKWFMFGYILCGFFTFVLHGAAFDELMMTESSSGRSGAILRMYILLPLILIPVYSFYTQIPTWLSAGLCASVGLYTIVSSASGRAASLVFLAGALLIFIGQKSARKMAKIKKNFVLFMCLAFVGMFVAKFAYSTAAKDGLLGEAAQKKYMMQTRTGDSLLKLLMGGRAEAFICVYAAMDKPIFGFGPWALDWNGYSRRFLDKYGAAEDAETRAQEDVNRAAQGRLERIQFLPFHSHIFGQWVWYGIVALFLWIYVLVLILNYFRKYIDVVPQWYGMLALIVPKLMWDIFFSPLFARVETAAAICCLLFAKAIFEGKMMYSREMWRERQKYLP